MTNVYRKLLRNSIIIPVLLLVLFIISIKYSLYKESDGSTLSGIKAEVLVINRDMGSELTGSLVRYLSKYCELVISDSPDAYFDYLSSVQYDYILEIPQFYQKDFMNGSVDSETLPHQPAVSLDDTGRRESLPLKFMVDGYLKTAQTYLNENKNITAGELVKKLDKDMQGEIGVYLEQKDREYQNNAYTQSYLMKASYILVFLCFFAIGRIRSCFGESGIRKRHEIAPISAAKNDFRLLLSNFVFVLFCDGLLLVLMFLLNPEIGLTWNIFIYFINFFVYSLCILGLCYMVSALALKHGINSILIIFFTVVMGFLNGDILGTEKESLISFAEFTPVYWLKNINTEVGMLNSFTWTEIYKILYMLGVNVLIAGAYFSISLVINKSRMERK
ncbi:ABC transporter permease [Anaerocolumna xylanovorans]|uniref:ABC-2 family transporter protein n=1 Tax=Anaerocolumna xylanovorans DSM 12503 TaxID=1121345 RepID=A0A1M7YJ37_9FIRM|nr:ABC transporter permease [Anaerocolumna xylanovorans]SHO52620.1 ABC-2 family transporter protein [Anaerocolumna xylanovorans DSM 12503]